MKKLLILLLAASMVSIVTLSACSPKDDDVDSKDETELSTAEPTSNLEEGELPFLSASEMEKSKSSSSVSPSKASGSDPAEGQPASEGATVSSDSPKKASDDAKDKSSDSEDKKDSAKKKSSESKKDSSSSSKEDNSKSSPTLSPGAGQYLEENGDELPFVPAN